MAFSGVACNASKIIIIPQVRTQQKCSKARPLQVLPENKSVEVWTELCSAFRHFQIQALKSAIDTPKAVIIHSSSNWKKNSWLSTMTSCKSKSTHPKLPLRKYQKNMAGILPSTYCLITIYKIYPYLVLNHFLRYQSISEPLLQPAFQQLTPPQQAPLRIP